MPLFKYIHPRNCWLWWHVTVDLPHLGERLAHYVTAACHLRLQTQTVSETSVSLPRPGSPRHLLPACTPLHTVPLPHSFTSYRQNRALQSHGLRLYNTVRPTGGRVFQYMAVHETMLRTCIFVFVNNWSLSLMVVDSRMSLQDIKSRIRLSFLSLLI